MLVLCSGCNRHTWSNESTCPFCGTQLTAPSNVDPLPLRVTRLALIAGTFAVAGCGSTGHSQPQPDPTSIVAPYGAPMPDPDEPKPEPQPEPQPSTQPSAKPDAPVPVPVPTDREAVPAYGAPPFPPLDPSKPQ